MKIDEKKVKKYVEELFINTNSLEQKQIFIDLKTLNSKLIRELVNEKMKNDLRDISEVQE